MTPKTPKSDRWDLLRKFTPFVSWGARLPHLPWLPATGFLWVQGSLSRLSPPLVNNTLNIGEDIIFEFKVSSLLSEALR